MSNDTPLTNKTLTGSVSMEGGIIHDIKARGYFYDMLANYGMILTIDDSAESINRHAEHLLAALSNMAIIVGQIETTFSYIDDIAESFIKSAKIITDMFGHRVSFCGEYHPAWKLATEIQNTDAPTLEQLKRWKETATHARG